MKGTACPDYSGGCHRSFLEFSLVTFFVSKTKKVTTIVYMNIARGVFEKLNPTIKEV